MKCLFFILNLWAALGVMAQTTVQPTFSQIYNANTLEEKLMGFKLAIKARPENDQNFIRKQNFDPKILFPKMTEVNGKLVFEAGKRKITMMISGTYEVEVDSKKFDFSPGKLENTYYALEKHFNSQKVSIVDFFIPTAHANSALVLVGAAAAATVAVAVWAIGDYHGPLNQAKLKCENFKHEISILHPDNQEWLIPRIKENMKRDLWNAEHNPRCLNGKNKEEGTCQGSRIVKDCIMNLTPELHRAIQAIDDSGREIERGEVPADPSEIQDSKSRSTAQ